MLLENMDSLLPWKEADSLELQWSTFKMMITSLPIVRTTAVKGDDLKIVWMLTNLRLKFKGQEEIISNKKSLNGLGLNQTEGFSILRTEFNFRLYFSNGIGLRQTSQGSDSDRFAIFQYICSETPFNHKANLVKCQEFIRKSIAPRKWVKEDTIKDQSMHWFECLVSMI